MADARLSREFDLTFVESLLAIAFAGFSAWLLWRAIARGEVAGRFGGVLTRSAAPIRFWVTVAGNLVALLIFASVGIALAHRALGPALLPQRAAAFYPTRALDQNASGLVILHCTVTPAFGVKDCSVASETPPGMGFGASALQISALEVLPEKDRPNAQPGQRINLPIRFKVPQDQQ